jgi:hypothetical protein
MTPYPESAKGAFAVALPTTDEYVLFLPSSTSAVVSAKAYVFNARTTAWTTWEIVASAAAHHLENDLAYIGGLTVSNQVHKERRNYGADWDGYDAAESVTITALTATTITLNASATVAVGDGIMSSAGGTVAKATAASSGTTVTVDSTTGLTTGAASLLHAFASTIEWAPVSERDPLAPKTWQEGLLFFEDLTGIYSVTLGFASELVSTFQTFAATLTRGMTADPRPWRFGLPREASCGSRIRPRIAITQAASRWALTALKLLWEPIGDRVRR